MPNGPISVSCCFAESGFQQNSLDEFPTGGREFITALRRPLRGVGPTLRPVSPTGWKRGRRLDLEPFIYF
jgi:hypothetical protein